MLNKVFFILLFSFFSCRDSIRQKKKSQPASQLPQIIKEDDPKNKGIVKWIRDDQVKSQRLPTAITRFISKGHKPIYSVSGDIDYDGREDLLLVTGIKNEDDLLLDTIIAKRELLLLLAKNNTFTLASRTENSIPRVNCYGMSHDAFAGIKTAKGQFTLLFYGGSNWKDTRASTFVFDEDKKDWYLENEIEEYFFMNYQNYEVDTLTKKNFGLIPISKFNIYKIYKIN